MPRSLSVVTALLVAAGTCTGLAPVAAAATGPAPATATAPASASSTAGAALDNGLATTPPMGWNDWYTFYCNVNEQLVVQTADAMVSSGMAAAGYNYVNLDDCWLDHNRDADGNLQSDPVKFPHGMKWLADYVHSKGLKLGIYNDVGTKTCAGYPGGYGHYQQDADTFASWGVDFVKVDWCNVPFSDFPDLTQREVAKKLYTAYGDALRNSGRPMVYSICEWNPALKPWTWAPAISNMWRSNNDYSNSWSAVLHNLDGEAGLSAYAGPGHWNDPDILMVGHDGGLNDTEDQAQFSLWSMLAAPLQAGNDLRNMSDTTKAILTNREVIAIDQDPLGTEADRVRRNGDADIWARPLANGDRAVVLLNRGTTPLAISTSASEIGLADAPAYTLRDVWQHSTTETAGRIAATVPPHSVVMYRVHPETYVQPAVAPATDVTPPASAPLPGTNLMWLQPGKANTVTATFTDDGAIGLDGVQLTLDVPDGWQVAPAEVTQSSLGRGQSLTGTWQVTPPADAKGTQSLTVHADYGWNGQAGTVSAQYPFQVGSLDTPTGSPWLSDVTPLATQNDWSHWYLDRSYYGSPITIHGVSYAKGLWVNANAAADYYLGGNCTRLTADLGLDDTDRSTGSVTYQVWADGQKVYDSGLVTNSTPTVHLSADLTGAKVLKVVVTDAGDGINYDNADLGGAQLTCGS